jgi:ABC-type bacteriocin/lantibiotic exporter with double-glycine peptidase domain
MSKLRTDLGALISVHGTSPAFLQRAAIVTVLSFIFFLAMLLVFYAREEMIYFVLSTAFLVVYIFTMIGWVMQKRNVVSIHKNGISYRKFRSTWDEIRSVRSDSKTGLTLVKTGGEKVTIGRSIADFDVIAVTIRKRLP